MICLYFRYISGRKSTFLSGEGIEGGLLFSTFNTSMLFKFFTTDMLHLFALCLLSYYSLVKMCFNIGWNVYGAYASQTNN